MTCDVILALIQRTPLLGWSALRLLHTWLQTLPVILGQKHPALGHYLAAALPKQLHAAAGSAAPHRRMVSYGYRKESRPYRHRRCCAFNQLSSSLSGSHTSMGMKTSAATNLGICLLQLLLLQLPPPLYETSRDVRRCRTCGSSLSKSATCHQEVVHSSLCLEGLGKDRICPPKKICCSIWMPQRHSICFSSAICWYLGRIKCQVSVT